MISLQSPCLDMVGVTGSIPVAPTKNKGFFEAPTLWVTRKAHAATLLLVLATPAHAVTLTLTDVGLGPLPERHFTLASLDDFYYVPRPVLALTYLDDPRDYDAYSLAGNMTIIFMAEEGVFEHRARYCEFWPGFDWAWCQIDASLLSDGME